MQQLKAGSFFAGIGGICKGLEIANFHISFANECDKHACISYKSNHPHIKLYEEKIETLNYNNLEDFDLFAGGFPCQPYSQAGKMDGLIDIRGQLFFNIIEILKIKKPSCILLENVPNLMNTNKGEDFKVILDHLRHIGYLTHYKVLGGHTHANIPQCRNRLFIVGFINQEAYMNFKFPDPIPLTIKIEDIIDFTEEKPNKYYYTQESQYFDMLNSSIINKSIYQMRRVYVRENKNNICPTLTANMGVGGHNVPIIRDNYGIRKLTPDECFKFQGFDNFKQIVANGHAYKQAGNSVIIPLITRLGIAIQEALKK